MADDNNEDDSWLYGSSNAETTENEESAVQSEEKPITETTDHDDIVEVSQNNESAEVNA